MIDLFDNFLFTFDFIFLSALIYLIIGSISDIKTLEVADFISYSLIAFGFFYNLLLSIFYQNYYYLIKSIFGFVLAFIIGTLLYYTGQWGGGDSKILFGLGSLFGLNYSFNFLQISEIFLNDFFIKFLINVFFLGAIYGILWILFLSLKNYKESFFEFKKTLSDKKAKYLRYFSGFFVIFFLYFINFSNFERLYLSNSDKIIFSLFLIIIYAMNYLFAYVKAVEKISMVKLIEPEKLTEGDWIVDDIIIEGSYITGPKELGITKEQIEKIIYFKKQGKIDKVKVKYGMPFIPSFLFSLLYTYFTSRLLVF